MEGMFSKWHPPPGSEWEELGREYCPPAAAAPYLNMSEGEAQTIYDYFNAFMNHHHSREVKDFYPKGLEGLRDMMQAVVAFSENCKIDNWPASGINSEGKTKPPDFQKLKWNILLLWAWDLVVEPYPGIAANIKERNDKRVEQERNKRNKIALRKMRHQQNEEREDSQPNKKQADSQQSKTKGCFQEIEKKQDSQQGDYKKKKKKKSKKTRAQTTKQNQNLHQTKGKMIPQKFRKRKARGQVKTPNKTPKKNNEARNVGHKCFCSGTARIMTRSMKKALIGHAAGRPNYFNGLRPPRTPCLCSLRSMSA